MEQQLVVAVEGAVLFSRDQQVHRFTGVQHRQGGRIDTRKVEAQAGEPAEGDAVAVVGENRRLLIFPLADVPTLGRGRGVILQKYGQGGLADIKTFTLAEGLSWRSGERTRMETDLTSWIGKRAQAGRLPPKWFARTNRFR